MTTTMLLPNHYRYIIDFEISTITGFSGDSVTIDSYEEYRKAVEARLHNKEFWRNTFSTITNQKNT